MKSKRKSRSIAALCACISLAAISVISASAATREYQGVVAEYSVSHTYAYIDITQNLGKVVHTAAAAKGLNYDSNISNWGNNHIFLPGQTVSKLTQNGVGEGTVVCAGIGYNYNENNFLFKYAK